MCVILRIFKVAVQSIKLYVLCPLHAVWNAKDRDKETVHNPNERITIDTRITNFTCYIVGVGPLE